MKSEQIHLAEERLQQWKQALPQYPVDSLPIIEDVRLFTQYIDHLQLQAKEPHLHIPSLLYGVLGGAAIVCAYLFWVAHLLPS